MMWFLCSCFWAVEILFEEDNPELCYLWSSRTLHQHLPWKSFGFFCNGKKKNIRKAVESKLTHFKGGCGRWSWEPRCSPGVCNSAFYFLDSPLHNSSSSSSRRLPGLQVSNLHKRHPLQLSEVKSCFIKQELPANSSASSSKHHGTAQRIMRAS